MVFFPTIQKGKGMSLSLGLVELFKPLSLEINGVDLKQQVIGVDLIKNLGYRPLGLAVHPGIND